ncbi:hypothetical protein L3476_08435 [Paenibacillus thiaminolyticus]|uniref:hypothetical protein n=1 Tax=Paenibacillus thiaminolyticus TaxID=49283 RepID=UPI0013F67E7A|nr:hypothetical protein [Paenibacillus thiaminolyticus]NGP59092.1 hypothetical protein [Paenibacillus thiaminolyticus]WCR28741.1 hypothetical protein L3476_08435 [Paenibacillus thiaminolyticus]
MGIETTQYSRGFFERFGFTAERAIPDGFASGTILWRWSSISRSKTMQNNGHDKSAGNAMFREA